MSLLWDRRTLRQLRRAAAKRNPRACRTARRRRWRRQIPALLRRWGALGFFFFGIVALCFGGGFLTAKAATLSAAAGYTALTWCLAALYFCTVLESSAKDYPEVPEALSLAPVGAEILGARARAFARGNTYLILAGSLMAAVGIIALSGGRHEKLGQPWDWSLAPAAAGILWLQLAALSSCVPSLRRALIRSRIKLPLRVAIAGMLALVFLIFAVIGLPFGLGGKQAGLIQPPGDFLSSILPPAAIMLWPSSGSLPLWQLIATGALVCCGLPNAREFLAKLRALPAIAVESDPFLPPDSGDWYEDDEEDAEAEAPPAPPSIPAPAGVVSPGLKEALEQPRCQPAYFSTDPFHVDRTIRPDIKALTWIFLPFAAAMVSGFSWSHVLAWIWLVANGIGLTPQASAPGRLRCFWSNDRTRQTNMEWLPLDPWPAWKEMERRHRLTLRETGKLALILATAGGILTAALTPIGQLWPWWRDIPGGLLDSPLRTGLAAAVAFTGAALLRRGYAPAAFAAELVPAGRLQWRGRLLRVAVPLLAALACGAVCTGGILLGICILNSHSTTGLAPLAAGAAGGFVLSEVLRYAAIRLAYRIFATGRRV